MYHNEFLCNVRSAAKVSIHYVMKLQYFTNYKGVSYDIVFYVYRCFIRNDFIAILMKLL